MAKVYRAVLKITDTLEGQMDDTFDPPKPFEGITKEDVETAFRADLAGCEMEIESFEEVKEQ